MPRITHQTLLSVSKAKSRQLKDIRWGAHLVRDTGYEIDELTAKAVTDRLQLARTILGHADEMLKMAEPPYRSIVSRAYYSMYHATRALSYYSMEGDDQEEHSKLPSGIPDDFPTRAHWENNLKSARLERNRADYDPYPKRDKNFKEAANLFVKMSHVYLPMVRKYMMSKGWKSK